MDTVVDIFLCWLGEKGSWISFLSRPAKHSATPLFFSVLNKFPTFSLPTFCVLKPIHVYLSELIIKILLHTYTDKNTAVLLNLVSFIRNITCRQRIYLSNVVYRTTKESKKKGKMKNVTKKREKRISKKTNYALKCLLRHLSIPECNNHTRDWKKLLLKKIAYGW